MTQEQLVSAIKFGSLLALPSDKLKFLKNKYIQDLYEDPKSLTNNRLLNAIKLANISDLLKKLYGAKIFLVEFTPFNSSPQIIKFDLAGINNLLPKITGTWNCNSGLKDNWLTLKK